MTAMTASTAKVGPGRNVAHSQPASTFAGSAAIQATIKRLLGTADSLLSLYLYAVFATAIAVGVLLLLGKVASRLGSESAIRREADIV